MPSSLSIGSTMSTTIADIYEDFNLESANPEIILTDAHEATPSAVKNLNLENKEETNVNIECSNSDVIYIFAAEYGRSDKPTPNCKVLDAKSKVQSTCQGKTECTFKVSNDLLGGDPCFGKSKSLHLRYLCHKDCSEGQFGENCTNSCSRRCADYYRKCDPVTGECLGGCRRGYTGHMCETECQNAFGRNCEKNCSETCKDTRNGSRCDIFNGACLEGCVAGYEGSSCQEVCNNQTYGENCEETCNVNCVSKDRKNRLCNLVTGSCLQGCRSGFKGDKCELLADVLPLDTTDRIFLYGASSMVLTLSAIFVLYIFVTYHSDKSVERGEAGNDLATGLSKTNDSASQEHEDRGFADPFVEEVASDTYPREMEYENAKENKYDEMDYFLFYSPRASYEYEHRLSWMEAVETGDGANVDEYEMETVV
ncbi:multiple epidermal growth factor-like domains 10 [Elysia marginata]|uniref:Multiple epidermal growth factor-like domains 10 n=1 Tax=Elysia marginata TaxID=1093978 RepID=A0AAV4FRS6_9GAST|nr:multiple epidermal growth factor-like domains 10 [Elysia marginata]